MCRGVWIVCGCPCADVDLRLLLHSARHPLTPSPKNLMPPSGLRPSPHSPAILEHPFKKVMSDLLPPFTQIMSSAFFEYVLQISGLWERCKQLNGFPGSPVPPDLVFLPEAPTSGTTRPCEFGTLPWEFPGAPSWQYRGCPSSLLPDHSLDLCLPSLFGLRARERIC